MLKDSNTHTKEAYLQAVADIDKEVETEKEIRKTSELNYIAKMKNLKDNQQVVLSQNVQDNGAFTAHAELEDSNTEDVDDDNFSIDIVKEAADLLQVTPDNKGVNKVPTSQAAASTSRQHQVFPFYKKEKQQPKDSEKRKCANDDITPKRSTTGGKRPRNFLPAEENTSERPTVGLKKPRANPIIEGQNCNQCRQYLDQIIKLQRENAQLKECLKNSSEGDTGKF